LYYDAPLPDGVEVIFACGPFGSLAPLGKQLSALPKSERPVLVHILTEQLANPNLPEWLRYGGGWLRSRLERWAFYQQPDGTWALRSWLIPFVTKFHRFRYYGDLYWLQKAGVLSVLAISSRWTADFLQKRGFDPIILPPSVMEGEYLELERDIPVLWLGKAGSSRRSRHLKQIRADLKARGIDILMVDGVEHPYVFGKERTILLNRTKIILNILREEWDDNSMRYVLAAPCRTLIVTEPTLPHSFFKPGVHLVEADISEIADTISYYLEHDEEREKIVEAAHSLVTNQSGLDKMIQIMVCVLEQRRQKESSIHD
jgi:hypothetical protein